MSERRAKALITFAGAGLFAFFARDAWTQYSASASAQQRLDAGQTKQMSINAQRIAANNEAALARRDAFCKSERAKYVAIVKADEDQRADVKQILDATPHATSGQIAGATKLMASFDARSDAAYDAFSKDPCPPLQRR